ncbi:hypothetical protein PPERSA_03595 [Pseudocohnilembus persalinus]|uniref:Uncharacterized protein n=1 Tax=Pseudocohnilembus persalinus TaxID=266149 RepID=A0A0V0QPN9_PSEPJ|nr:hypothetical protein PPERSA_03595 [Pseudocohnilembus persalinus]|eukprot:KRX04355.1 hypothetical protein PPERSA_03595 [Pseudocohnilembus persalinus]
MEDNKKFIIKSEKKRIEEFEQEHKDRLLGMKETVEYICLEGNSYSKKFCQEFAEVLKQLDNLKYLDLQNIFVSRLKDEIPESLQYIGDSLIGKNIIELDLSDNAVNPFGAKALQNYLSQAKSLKKFYINNCGLGPEGTETIAQALEKGTPNLEVLAIARNRAEDKGGKAVGIAVGKMENFRELHIYQDVVRKEGMVHLLENLRKCKKLEILDIRDNFLKEEAIEEMAKLIKETKTLKGLNLSDCNMEEEDNDAIIEALQESTNDFQKFGYNYNELSGKQAQALLDAILKNSTKLERLDIKGNEFRKGTQKYYQDKLEEKGCKEALSLFESDDEDEETQNLIETFSHLKIQ